MDTQSIKLILLCFLTLAVFRVHTHPICKPDLAVVTVYENIALTTLITSLNCSSSEGDEELSYDIISGGDTFQIYPQTGEVTLEKELNYHTQKNYTVLIRVFDGGTPKSGITFLLIIHVLPDNEEPLLILNPNPVIDNVPESTLGEVITTINVSRHGRPTEDGEVTFTITAGNDLGLFHVDHFSGSIYAIQQLDYETQKTHHLQIAVSKHSVTGHVATNSTNVTINLSDVNEFPPDCKTFLTVTLKEDNKRNKKGGRLINLSKFCSERDGWSHPYYPFMYSIRFVRDYELFRMDGSGYVRLKLPIDPDTEKNIYFQPIVVREFGVTSMRTTSLGVLVNIIGVDDNPTVWEDNVIYQELPEDSQPGGSSILTLKATDGDRPDSPEGRIRYGLQSGNGTDHFYVNPGGEVYLIKPVDREVNEVFRLTVYAFTENSPEIQVFATVILNISDINDNQPKFEKSVYTMEIPENRTFNGQPLITVSAYDPDSGENGSVTYHLSENDFDLFSIDNVTGDIHLLHPLNFETATSHTLTVLSRDGGVVSLSSSTTVIVLVLPVNEFSPLITQNVTASVTEGAALGTLVTFLNATDGDQGPDGAIVYQTASNIFPFQLDKKSGQLFLVGNVDRESTNIYTLIVIVSDLSPASPRYCNTSVIITVLDINDNSPTCYPPVTPVTLNGKFHGSELFSPLEVTQLHCTDADNGVNAELSYSLASTNYSREFTIDISGTLIMLKPPKISPHYLRVFVKDGGEFSLSCSVWIVISIDLPPLTSNLPETIHVFENTSIGSVIYTIQTNSQRQIDLSIISGDDHQIFSLAAWSGKLYITKFLDREICDKFVVQVETRDVRAGLVSSANLTIYIEDINDNPPTFEQNVYFVSISERLKPKSFILTLFVIDNDFYPVNKQFNFSIIAGDKYENFTISPTGEVRITNKLDYKVKSHYELTVEVRDSFGPEHFYDIATVHIDVIKEIQDPPNFNFSAFNRSVNIREDFPIGGVVVHVTVNDLDKADITYRLMSGKNNTFDIDRLRGQIYLTSHLDRETADYYQLTVVASYSTRSLTSTTTLDIQISDINDNNPQCPQDVFHTEVSELATIDTALLNLTCSDADLGNNSQIYYSIITGNDENKFKMNYSEIIINDSLNFAENNLYKLKVEARDNGIPFRSAICIVIIQTSRKPSEIRFSQQYLNLTLPENTSVGSEVVNCGAMTAAASLYEGSVIYSITGDNSKTHFHIEETTGKLFLTWPLDAEVGHVIFTLNVKVADTDFPTWTNTLHLDIFVQDVNDNPPQFSENQYFVKLSRNSSNGSIVFTPNVTDADSGKNAVLSFTLYGNGSSDFYINSHTGDVTFLETFSGEKRDRYILEICVTDSGYPNLKSKASVFITVVENQNKAPVFLQSEYVVAANEDSPIGTTIFQVVAFYDNDIEQANGILRYSIVGGNEANAFTIDELAGTIFVSASLDREKTDFYQLKISCKDREQAQMSSVVSVNITVQDSNDNPPIFEPRLYFTALPKSVDVGYQFGRVTAADRDLFYNGAFGFSISSGNENRLFHVDIDSGVVSVASGLYEQLGKHILTIKVYDYGTPSLSSFATYTINIIHSGIYAFSVEENLPIGYYVGTVSEFDGALYTITSGDLSEAFTIDKQDGSILTAFSLDRELISEYHLTILVQEAKNPWNWYRVSVTILVDDVNDNDPVFSQSNYTTYVVDRAPVGFTIIQLTVSDKDLQENGEFYFEIEDMFMSPLYGVSNETSELFVKESPNIYYGSTYKFDVRVIDKGMPYRTGETTVTVNVISSSIIQESIFISFDCQSDVENGHIIYTLTSDAFKFRKSSIKAMEYITDSFAGSPFTANKVSGEIKVLDTDRITENSKFIYWVVGKALLNDGRVISTPGIIRIDVFNPLNTFVTLQTNIPTRSRNISGAVDNVLAELASLLPNDKIILWKIDNSIPRKKRDTVTGISLVVYGVKSKSIDSIGDLEHHKEFIEDHVLVSILKSVVRTKILSNSSYRISSLHDYQQQTTSHPQYKTANRNALILLICIAAVLFILCTILLVVYKRTGKIGVRVRNDICELGSLDELLSPIEQGPVGDEPVLSMETTLTRSKCEVEKVNILK